MAVKSTYDVKIIWFLVCRCRCSN